MLKIEQISIGDFFIQKPELDEKYSLYAGIHLVVKGKKFNEVILSTPESPQDAWSLLLLEKEFIHIPATLENE